MNSKAQLTMLKKQRLAYGGELQKKHGRKKPRPLSTKNSIHLVLRSKKAVGMWSFREAINREKIRSIVSKFSRRYSISVIGGANVGNHLHFHMKLSKIAAYKPFIRAITAAIRMAVTGRNKWTAKDTSAEKFWDYRPFTRVILSYRAYLNMKDYIKINRYEGAGISRKTSVELVRKTNWLETG